MKPPRSWGATRKTLCRNCCESPFFSHCSALLAGGGRRWARLWTLIVSLAVFGMTIESGRPLRRRIGRNVAVCRDGLGLV